MVVLEAVAVLNRCANDERFVGNKLHVVLSRVGGWLGKTEKTFSSLDFPTKQ